MAVKIDTHKEIIFASSDPNVSRILGKKKVVGKLRKVAPCVYKTNLTDILEKSCVDTFLIYLFTVIRMR